MADGQALMFTYGTLKRDFANHSLVQTLMGQNDATFMGTCITRNSYPLVLGPYGAPYLINLPNATGTHPIKGELYSLSSRGLRLLDELEATSAGHYERLPIQVQLETGGEEIVAEAYCAHRSYGERMWKLKENAALTEFTEKLDKGFVRKADRVDGSCMEAIQSLLSHV